MGASRHASDRRTGTPGTLLQGEVTLLFSDVVGSTALLSSEGDRRFVEMLQAHNALARRAWADHGGHEVKTAGDGFMVAFETPRAAVLAAAQFQRSLRASGSPMQVRIGVHAGDAVRDENDFFGHTVVTAARIGALAGADEILVSAAVVTGLGEGDGVSLGVTRERTLKGLPGRHEIVSVVWDDGSQPAAPASRGRADQASATLVDRSEELTILRHALAADAPGGVVYVQAAAGVGKSALVEVAVALAQDAGRQVLTARGGELERDFPFGLVRQALLPALGRPPDKELFTGPARLAGAALGLEDGELGADALGRALNGLHWLCANLAERAPLLLVCDDAHWADQESLQFLAYLARRLSDLPVVILVCARPAEPGADSALLGQLESDAMAVLRPRPLTAAGCATLIGSGQAVPVDPEFSDACHRASGGNPFYLRALLVEAAGAGIEPTAANAAAVERLGPRQIALATIVRIGRAAPGAAELARAAAILGTSAEPRMATALADLDPAKAAGAADALRIAGIFRMSTELEFVHPVTRNAALNDIAPGERARLHRRAAGLLIDEGAPPDRVAAHLIACEPSGDPAVTAALSQAAAAASRAGAPSVAAEYLRRALAEPPTPADRRQVVLQLARAEMLVAPAAAPARFREAFELTAAPNDRADVVLELYEALIPLDARADCRDLVERTLDAFEDRGEPRAMLLRKRLAEMDQDGWYPWLEEQLARLADLPDSAFTRELRLHRPMAVALGSIAPVPKEVLVQDILFVREHSTPAQSGPGEKAGFAINCLHLERPDLAETLIAEAHDAVAASGTERGRLRLLTVQAGLSDNLQVREDLHREAIALAEELGLPSAMPGLRANLADALVDRGFHEQAEQQLQLAGLPADYRGERLGAYSFVSGGLMYLLEIRGRMRLACGRLEGAAEDLMNVARKAAPHGDRATVHATAAIALAGLGRDEEARRFLAVDEAWADVVGCRRPIGRVLIAKGLVQRDESGLASLRRATEVLHGVPLAASDHARAHLEYGAALRRAGERKAARAELRAALELAIGAAADGLAARAREELSASGARLTRERTAGPASLTPSELRVARLAADGHTNREIAQRLFLAQKTVEMHVGRVLRKLEVDGRTDIDETLREAGLRE